MARPGAVVPERLLPRDLARGRLRRAVPGRRRARLLRLPGGARAGRARRRRRGGRDRARLPRAQRRRAPAAQLLVRVGIDSGVVLASEMGFGASRQPLVVGSVPNRAARIQAAAQPNTVVISEATHRLVHGAFVCESIGRPDLRGQDQPVELFQVVRARQAQSPAADSARLTPLVGRAAEIDVMTRSLARGARRARGRSCCLSGDAGVGKSRLVRELKARDRRRALLQVRVPRHAAQREQRSLAGARAPAARLAPRPRALDRRGGRAPRPRAGRRAARWPTRSR